MSASLWLASVLERIDIEIYEDMTCKQIIWVWKTVTESQSTMYC